MHKSWGKITHAEKMRNDPNDRSTIGVFGLGLIVKMRFLLITTVLFRILKVGSMEVLPSVLYMWLPEQTTDLVV